MPPADEYCFCFFHDCLNIEESRQLYALCVSISSHLLHHLQSSLWESAPSYLLLSRLGDVLVGVEEGTNVHGLTAPDLSVDCPVEGEFEAAAVEGAGTGNGSVWVVQRSEVYGGLQDGLLVHHCGDGLAREAAEMR